MRFALLKALDRALESMPVRDQIGEFHDDPSGGHQIPPLPISSEADRDEAK
jgi:hypothetical protein